MRFLVSLGITAITMVVLSSQNYGFHINGFIWALGASLILGIVNATLGAILSLIFHALSMGFFFILGLSVVIRTVVLAICLNIVDSWMDNMSLKGFWASIITAVFISVAGALADHIGKDKND